MGAVTDALYEELRKKEKPKSLKLAIIQVFKLEGEKPGDLLGQMKAMTDQDLADFARIFTDELGWEFAPSPT